MKIYEVVGERKEYYLRCERELVDRQERLLRFLEKELGIDRGDVLEYNTSHPWVAIKNPGKYSRLKERRDVKVKEKAFHFLKGEFLRAEISPDRRTKEGRTLSERWKEVLAGEFGLIFHATEPFFLRVSPWNCTEEERPYVSGRVKAVVRREGDRIFLLEWEGFDPDKLPDFREVEL